LATINDTKWITLYLILTVLFTFKFISVVMQSHRLWLSQDISWSYLKIKDGGGSAYRSAGSHLSWSDWQCCCTPRIYKYTINGIN